MFTKSIFILINICNFIISSVELGSSQNLIVFHINERQNLVAQNAVQTALEYISINKSYNLEVDYQYVQANVSNEETALKSVCAAYDSILNARKPIHLILDTSINKMIGRLVGQFSIDIGVPVVSTNPVDLRYILESNTFVSVILPQTMLQKQLKSFSKQQIMYTCVVIMDDTSLFRDDDFTQFRATLLKFNFNIFPQINDHINADIKHFIFIGKSRNARWLLQEIVKYYQPKKKLKWYIFVMDINTLITDFKYTNVMFINPFIPAEQKTKLLLLKNSLINKNWDFGINDIFYFEVALNAFLVANKLNLETPISKRITYIKCKEEYKKTVLKEEAHHFHDYFEKHKFNDSLYGQVKKTESKSFYITLNMNISKIEKNKVCSLGTWSIDDPPSTPTSLPREIVLPPLKIVAILEPLLFEDQSAPNGLNGLYIDLINNFAKKYRFRYSIVIGKTIGDIDGNKQWNGAIKDLIDRKADIVLGFITINSLAECVVDFTTPIGEHKGFAMLAKKFKRKSLLFEFLYVFENNVWICFIYTYISISMLLWILDNFSPYSSRNNKKRLSKTEKEFTLKECLWFCLISLTPQGGGALPRNHSGKIFIVTWWIFGFILITAYTDNLASFMTISRIYSHINTISDLFEQHDISYGPYINSSAYYYFNDMETIEKLLFTKWKDISLSRNYSDYEKSQFAVWTNPIKESNSLFIKEFANDFPNSLKEAIKRVKETKTGQAGYVYIGDALDAEFLALTDCDLEVIGSEFSRRPHGFALQKDSPLKEIFDKAITELVRNHEYDELMEKWWYKNSKRMICSEEREGIDYTHLIGLFMLLVFGICIACITLCLEFYLFKRKLTLK